MRTHVHHYVHAYITTYCIPLFVPKYINIAKNTLLKRLNIYHVKVAIGY